MLTHINQMSISRSRVKVPLGTACGDPCHSCQVIACLWAPLVATPFSVTYVVDICEKIGHHQWRPTFLHTYIISHWAPPGRLSFLLFGHRQWRPLLHSSFLWAPPVATQFSVVRASTVATFVLSFLFIPTILWGGDSPVLS